MLGSLAATGRGRKSQEPEVDGARGGPGATAGTHLAGEGDQLKPPAPLGGVGWGGRSDPRMRINRSLCYTDLPGNAETGSPPPRRYPMDTSAAWAIQGRRQIRLIRIRGSGP